MRFIGYLSYTIVLGWLSPSFHPSIDKPKLQRRCKSPALSATDPVNLNKLGSLHHLSWTYNYPRFPVLKSLPLFIIVIILIPVKKFFISLHASLLNWPSSCALRRGSFAFLFQDDDNDDLDGDDDDANVGDGGDVDNWRIPVLGDCFSVSGAQGMIGPGYNLIASP